MKFVVKKEQLLALIDLRLNYLHQLTGRLEKQLAEGRKEIHPLHPPQMGVLPMTEDQLGYNLALQRQAADEITWFREMVVRDHETAYLLNRDDLLFLGFGRPGPIF